MNIEDKIRLLGQIERATPSPFLDAKIQQRLAKSQEVVQRNLKWAIGIASVVILANVLVLSMNNKADELSNGLIYQPNYNWYGEK